MYCATVQVLKGQEGALQQLEEAGLLLQAAERTQQEISGGLRDLQRGLALEAGTSGGGHSSGLVVWLCGEVELR